MILQKEPHNPAALFYRAYANTHLRHFDLAKNDLNDLLIVVPNHFEARLSLAIVLQQLGRKQEALDNLNQISLSNSMLTPRWLMRLVRIWSDR